ncbi:UNVERIFIED_CONTAM: Serine/threonine-protein kinase Nek8 [Sesamum angustifolium]|uniref:Serine/threonine-protein kinase Nek8 n=1 Tax=Sesamum angustifolium TaxID=2727405 RepID=A0AAW2Q901_9LAMI
METAMERTQQAVQEDDEEQQEIWSWGAGTDGQLATGRLQDEHSPQLLCSLSAFGPIIFLSCGGAHVIALSPGGRVLTWGRGTSGQLGHGEMVSSLQPKAVKALESFTITHVSAGWNHSGFVSVAGGARYTCGDGSFGTMVHRSNHKFSLSSFSSKQVSKLLVVCATLWSYSEVNVDHQVYGFGSGKRGQLGVSTEKIKSTSLPQITMGLTNVRIMNISANGDHSAALSGEGEVFMLGGDHHGALSDPRNILLTGDVSVACFLIVLFECLLCPKAETSAILDASISYYNSACMFPITVFISFEAEILLSHNDLILTVTGKLKEGIMRIRADHSETKAVQIAAGAPLCLNNGSVMTWGWGEHGQLGLGDTNDQAVPQVVSLAHKSAEKHPISRVYCGSGFSFVLRTCHLGSQTRQRKLKI